MTTQIGQGPIGTGPINAPAAGASTPTQSQIRVTAEASTPAIRASSETSG